MQMRLKPAKICNSLRSIDVGGLILRAFSCFCGCCCICRGRGQTNNSNKTVTSWKKELKLIYYTFFYNQNNDSLTVLETFLFPFAEAMTNFIKILGYFLVLVVWILLLNMIYIFYVLILPQIFDRAHGALFVLHLLLGTWLGINTFFHYFMGATTNPGEPPKELIGNVVSMCKKCVSPKPARTHHCSVCRKCILKMDHHCPWFNNCIGFYNHRYFFMFCVFLVLDCVYLSTIGFHYYQMMVYPSQDLNLFSTFMQKTQLNVDLENLETYYSLTTAEFFVCFVAGIAVLGLALVNGFIISQGATNIEIRSLRIPCIASTLSSPRSPYDAGFVKNWKIFLGFSDFKTFFTHVLLPSAHKPLGDGVNWTEYFAHSQSDAFIV